MNRTKLNLIRSARVPAAAFLASAAILTTGCSNFATTASTPLVNSAASIAGKVHGGNQPVTGATVYLYQVGMTGVGQGSTLLATTTTDQNANFAFTKSASTGTTFPTSGNTYACPGSNSADPELYLLVRGGNTAGAGTVNTNSAAAFLAPLGYCSQVSSSTFVEVSEVTTVATVAALGQFINPSTDLIGNDGIAVAYQAVNASFKTIPKLVSANTGLAVTSTTATGAASGVGVSGVTVTATPETAKINTIANIISACVNQASANSGTACTTLFANALPPAASTTSQPNATFPAATDTVQAALYMMLNPNDSYTTDLNNLFSLQTANPPYQPSLSVAPTDWTIGISYQTSSNCSGGSSSNAFINDAYDLNVDVAGNIWLANQGSLASLAPGGVPSTCLNFGGSSRGGTIDSQNNIWYASASGNAVYRYTPSSNTTITFGMNVSPMAMTADGFGNIFISSTNGTTGSVYEIKGGATANISSSPTAISTTVGPNPTRMFADTAGDIWVSSGSSFISELVLTTGAPTGYATTPFNATSPTYGITVGKTNIVYVTSQDANSTLSAFAPGTNGGFSQVYSTGANRGGMNNPTALTLDGAQSSWVPSTKPEASGAYALAVVNNSGQGISNNGTYAGAGYQKGATYLNSGGRVAVVDSSGNVWVSSDGIPGFLTEFVGSAAAIYQPYAYANAQSGRFQQIP